MKFKFKIERVATYYFTELLTSNLKFAHSLVLDSDLTDILIYHLLILQMCKKEVFFIRKLKENAIGLKNE